MTGTKVMTRSPPNLSGSTTSFFMLMSEYGHPKALKKEEDEEEEAD